MARLEKDGATDRLLSDLASRSRRTTADELHDAVTFRHRSFVGDPAEQQLGIPFKKALSELDAEILIRQSSPSEFVLEEPFRYVSSGESEVLVRRGDKTDLASVPSFLTWFVPRYGRHTLPALLHDQLVEPGMDPDERERADTLLRDSMGETGVPLVRRWLMWAAISMATHWQRRWWSKALVVVWLVLAAAAGCDLALRLIGWRSVPGASSWGALGLVLAAPILLGIVWRRRYAAGVIGAYGVILLLGPLVVIGITLILYSAFEGVGQVGLKLLKRRRPSTRINPVRVSRMSRM